jgi:hypothetical protein
MAFIFSMFPHLVSKKFVFLIYIFCAILVNLSLRIDVFFSTGDLPGYLFTIEKLYFDDFLNVSSQIKMNHRLYNKEILFWYPSVTIFSISENPFHPFIFFDIVFYLSMFFGIQKILESETFKFIGPKLTGLYFVSLIYYPNMHNLSSSYRQAIASSLIVLSLGLILSKKQWKSIIVFCSAILIHNPTLLFFPLLLLFNLSIKKALSVIVILAVIVYFAVTYLDVPISFLTRLGSGLADGGSIGVRDFSVLLTVFLLSSFLSYRRQRPELNSIVYQQLYCVLLFVMFLIFFGVVDSNRLFFYIVVILFPQLIILLHQTIGDNFKSRIFTLNFLPFLPWVIF